MALSQGHFVSKFYLRGFTLGGDEYDELFVFDQTRGTTWKSCPLNAAKESGMYAVDCPTPQLMEDAMSRAESIWRPIFATLIEHKRLPTTARDWTELLGFIAVMFLRVPRQREWYRQLAPLCGEEGSNVANQQLAFVYGIGSSAAKVASILRQRRWTLWTCNDDAPDLICSDNPVSVTRLSPSDWSEQFGIATRHTIVSMPISRRMAIVGVHDEQLAKVTLNREEVAALNSATAMYAGQVYSATGNFVWMNRDLKVLTEKEFLAK